MSAVEKNHQRLSIGELIALRGRLTDRWGGWIAGDGVYSHGEDLLRDMVPNKSYFHVLILNIFGELPDERFCKTPLQQPTPAASHVQTGQ